MRPLLCLDQGTAQQETAGPVILLHGFLGEPADWDAVVAELTVARPIWRADLLAASAATARVADLAKALSEAIRSKGLAPAIIVGYSLGARVAMACLASDPEAVARVVAVSGTPGLVESEERAGRAAADDRLAEALAREGLGPFIEHWYAQPLFASLRSHPDYALVARRRVTGDGREWARVLRDASPGRTAPLWDDLPRLAPKLELVVGSLDGKYQELARLVGERVPDLPVTIVEGAGHAIHLERPAALAALIDRLP